MTPTYLDNNASTALDERVLEAMTPYLGGIPGNASSLHRYGRLQRDAIETARAQIAALTGAQPEQVVFTSGGTEANNLVLQGVMAATGKPSLAIGATEHMSVIQPAEQLVREGRELHVLPVDQQGVLDLAAFDGLLQQHRDDLGIVSVMMANNETGVLQDMQPLVDRLQGSGIYLHTDATQMVGKLPVDFAASGVNAMTLSAHKIYGPQGIGALLIDRAMPIEARIYGGSQEQMLRAGTENVAAIAGFGKAAELSMQEMSARRAQVEDLRDACEKKLTELPGVEVFSAGQARLPNTLQFGVHGFDGETLLMQFDRAGVAVSSGSACTSGKTEPSHVLQAMAVPRELALSSVRVSFGKDNTLRDVDHFIDSLASITQMKTHAVMAANV